MRRSLRLGALLVLVLGAVVGVDARAQQQGADRTITYSVAVRGSVASDVEAFAAHAAATLADARGWSLGGAVAYQRVPTGGEFTLWLAEASTVPSFSPSCSATYSCRVGRNVIINETRWRTGTSTWTLGLDAYRRYVVLHEVGHWLGLGHVACPGAGRPAPVMFQQSKGSGGCAFNVWPLEDERQAAGRSLGVAVRPVSPPPPPCTDRIADPDLADRFVDAVYVTVLGRPADPGGRAAWSDRLDAGGCRQDVVRALQASGEGRGVVVDRHYLALLSRRADAGGRAAFVDQLGRGVGWDGVALGLLGSGEAWSQAGATAEGFADLLFQRVLGRSADAGGRAWLSGVVAQRGQRAAAETLWWSGEAVARRVDQAYRHVLGRGADGSGAQHHAALARRLGDAAVVVALAASDEYLARA